MWMSEWMSSISWRVSHRLRSRGHRPGPLLLVHRPAQVRRGAARRVRAGAGALPVLAAGPPPHPRGLPLPSLLGPLYALGLAIVMLEDRPFALPKSVDFIQTYQ